MPFAIIKTGGKQYKVQEGAVLSIEKLPEEAKKGGKITFSEVLLIDDGKETIVGKPLIAGATVTAEVAEEGRAKTVRVVRYKAKSRYHKVYGHRQPYTKVKIVSL
jgi:large subunit ribosomal protein L21